MLDFVVVEEDRRAIRDIKEILEVHTHILKRIEKSFFTPTKLTSSFGGNTMPIQLTVGQSVVQTLTESNTAGAVPVIPANLADVPSDPTVATVVDNNDGTFTWTAVAPGTVITNFSDTVYGLAGTDTITVVPVPPPPPTEIESTFGIPV